MSLKFQLIPQMFKNINLHNEKIRIIEPDKWKEISSKVRDEQKECHYCGRGFVRFELEAHEVWVFDNVRHVQKLVDIVSACKLCHHTIHYDNFHSEKWKHKNYYMAINDCTNSTFERELKAAQDKADIGMEDNDWKLDISYILERGYAELQDINIENLEDFAIGSSRFLIGIPKKSNAEKAAMLLDECKVLEDSRNEIDLKILDKRSKADLLISRVRTGKAAFGVDTEKIIGEAHKKWMTIHDIEREIKDLIQNPDSLTEKDPVLTVSKPDEKENPVLTLQKPEEDETTAIQSPVIDFNSIPKKYIIYDSTPISGGTCQICKNKVRERYMYWGFYIKSYDDWEQIGYGKKRRINCHEMFYSGQKEICSLCWDTIYNGRKKLFKRFRKTTRHFIEYCNCNYSYKEAKRIFRNKKNEYKTYKNKPVFIRIPVPKVPSPVVKIVAKWLRENGAVYNEQDQQWRLYPSNNLYKFKDFFVPPIIK